jgi:hypothetical protein
MPPREMTMDEKIIRQSIATIQATIETMCRQRGELASMLPNAPRPKMMKVNSARTHTLAGVIESDLLNSANSEERHFTDTVAASVLWQVEHNLADVTSSLNELWGQCQEVLAAHCSLLFGGAKHTPPPPRQINCNAKRNATLRKSRKLIFRGRINRAHWRMARWNN